MVRPIRSIVTAAALLACCPFVARSAQADAYPTHAISLIVPYAAGGGSDIMARRVAERLSRHLGQSVVVENLGGGGGAIGMQRLAKSQPDGYTIGLALHGQLAINPALYPKLSYDPVKDFAPVTLIAKAPYLIVTSPQLPVTNAAQFLDYVRSHPGQLSYASSGTGGGAHLAAELLKSTTRLDLTHIPYKGGALAMPDLLTGRVPIFFAAYATVKGYVVDGKVRALAVTTRQRADALPDLPSISELDPSLAGYDVYDAHTIVAPKGTPAAIVDRLNKEMVAIIQEEEFRKLLMADGMQPIGSTPAELAEFITTEIAKWDPVVKAAIGSPD